jgi:hypothetical protein
MPRRPHTNASFLALLTSALHASAAGCAAEPDEGSDSRAGKVGTRARDGAAEATSDAAVVYDAAQTAEASAAIDAHILAESGTAATEAGWLVPAGDAAQNCPTDQRWNDERCGPVTIRRPFLVGAALRHAQPAARGDWLHPARSEPAQQLDAVTRTRLAESWLQDALEEHASIAAFARLTLQLLALGAPPELIADAQRASLDEVAHAQSCFALAARYGAGARGPAPLSLQDALDTASLPELARLGAEEGCVGETLGAVLAREQLAAARDPFVVSLLRRVAADEARHAELAWRIAHWALARGGRPVREALADGLEHAIAGTLTAERRTYAGIDQAAFHAHGRLTCDEAHAVAEQAVAQVVRPAAAALLGARSAVGALPRSAPV